MPRLGPRTTVSSQIPVQDCKMKQASLFWFVPSDSGPLSCLIRLVRPDPTRLAFTQAWLIRTINDIRQFLLEGRTCLSQLGPQPRISRLLPSFQPIGSHFRPQKTAISRHTSSHEFQICVSTFVPIRLSTQGSWRSKSRRVTDSYVQRASIDVEQLTEYCRPYALKYSLSMLLANVLKTLWSVVSPMKSCTSDTENSYRRHIIV